MSDPAGVAGKPERPKVQRYIVEYQGPEEAADDVGDWVKADDYDQLRADLEAEQKFRLTRDVHADKVIETRNRQLSEIAVELDAERTKRESAEAACYEWSDIVKVERARVKVLEGDVQHLLDTCVPLPELKGAKAQVAALQAQLQQQIEEREKFWQGYRESSLARSAQLISERNTLQAQLDAFPPAVEQGFEQLQASWVAEAAASNNDIESDTLLSCALQVRTRLHGPEEACTFVATHLVEATQPTEDPPTTDTHEHNLWRNNTRESPGTFCSLCGPLPTDPPVDRQGPPEEPELTPVQVAEILVDYNEWLAKRNVSRLALTALVERWEAMTANAFKDGPIPNDEVGHVARWTMAEMMAAELRALMEAK